MSISAVIYVVAAAVITTLVGSQLGLLIGAVELNLLVARVQAPLALLLLLFAGIIFLLDLSVHAVREYAWRARTAGTGQRVERRAPACREGRIAHRRIEGCYSG